jgi:hypothetical protein
MSRTQCGHAPGGRATDIGDRYFGIGISYPSLISRKGDRIDLLSKDGIGLLTRRDKAVTAVLHSRQ